MIKGCGGTSDGIAGNGGARGKGSFYLFTFLPFYFFTFLPFYFFTFIHGGKVHLL